MKRNKMIMPGMVALILALGTVACKHLPLDIPLVDNGPGNNNGGGDTLNFGIPCDPDTVYFQNDILPLLVSNCAISGCHDAETHEEGIILSTYADVMNDHDDLIDPGDAGNSELYEQLFESGDDRMPPEPNDPLTAAEKDLIATWIEQGALDNYCEDCDTSAVTYATAIEPIISSFCLGCHDGTSASTDVDLTDYNGVSSVAADGRLYGAVNHEAGYVSMPYGGSWLPQCQIDQIRIWVEAGFPNN